MSILPANLWEISSEDELTPLLPHSDFPHHIQSALDTIGELELVMVSAEERSPRVRYSSCCGSYKKALIGHVAGSIVFVAAAVYVPMALSKTLNEIQADLTQEHVEYKIPQKYIERLRLGGVGLTVVGHVWGQVTVMITELVGLKSPPLSLREFVILTSTLRDLKNNRQLVQNTQPLNSIEESGALELYDAKYNSGKQVFWRQTGTYVRNISFIAVLTIDVFVFCWVWLTAVKMISVVGDKIETHFLPKHSTPHRTLHHYTNMTLVSPKDEIEELIENTMAIGYFTGAVGPVTKYLCALPGLIKETCQRCRKDDSEEVIDQVMASP